MKECLVDVKKGKRIVHTFPVTVSDPLNETKDEAYKRKGLEAAAYAKVTANEELAGLEAEMHVSRSGALEPPYDPLGVLAETKAGLNEFVRERAYFLWEQVGRPDGQSEVFWHQAQHQRWSERAYALWEREGCPTGKADDHWFRTCDFEKQ